MNIKKSILLSIVLLIIAAPLPMATAAPAPQAALPSGFIYQGQLKTGDTLVNSTCDFQFGLWDAASAGTQIGATSAVSAVTVSGGSFTALVNAGDEFGPKAFDGSPRWLEISVQCAGESTFTQLAPRQPLSAAPYASYAGMAAQAGSVPWSGVVGAPTFPSAGTGLLLSSGQFQLASGYQLPQSCADGAIPLWNGAGWSCSSNYAALTHSHTPGQISPQGSQSGLDADRLDGQDAAAFQPRVSGSCAVGSTIRAINADGSVICQSDASFQRSVPRANRLTTVDSSGAVGQYTSLTIGADGLPLISYYDALNGDLRAAHCGDATCSISTLTTVDSTGLVGQYTSLAIGADGLPVISYFDNTNSDLKVAHCGDEACASGITVVTLDSTGLVGLYTSLTIGSDGLPVISYYDNTNGDLKVAHCGNAVCSVVTTTAVDSAGSVGAYSSIAIGTDGLPVISYFDNSNARLKVAHCGNAACLNGNTLTTVDGLGSVGAYTSLTIGVDGLPVIRYRDNTNNSLKVAHCGDAACASGNTMSTVDSIGTSGSYGSMTIGADGLPVISYFDYTNGDSKVAHCRDVACSTSTLTTLDSAGIVGDYSSITIGADGLPLISYFYGTGNDLKVAACANAMCLPYFRRR